MEKMPNDVLENLMKNICDGAKNHEFRFNDGQPCDSSFFDAIKDYLISSKMFDPQTDELTIRFPAKEPYHFDVKVVKPIYKFDFTIEPLPEGKNE